MYLALSKHPALLNEQFSSSQGEVKAFSTVMSHSFVVAVVLVCSNDIAGSESKENAPFM